MTLIIQKPTGAKLNLAKDYTWYPLLLPGVVAWWDAANVSTFTFSSGNVVQNWSSVVGSYTLTQATTANRPTRSGTINGKASVVFDGTNDSLSVASFNLTGGGQKLSIWAVFSATSGSLQIIAEHSANYNLISGAFILFRNTSNQASFGKKENPGTYTTFDNSTSITTTPAATVSTHDGALSTNESIVYVNGSSIGSGTNGNTNANNINDTLFVGARGGTSLFLNGQIAELGFTTNVITDSDRLLLQQYLAAKWGTP